MTSEAIALALDPERKKYPHWWKYTFVGKNASGCSISGDKEMAASQDWMPTGEPSDNLPPLATDRVAAFEHVVPALSACGLLIEIYPHGCYVRDDESRNEPEMPWSSWVCISGDDNDDGTPQPLAPACAAAVAWMRENDRERWDAAVREVGA